MMFKINEHQDVRKLFYLSVSYMYHGKYPDMHNTCTCTCFYTCMFLYAAIHEITFCNLIHVGDEALYCASDGALWVWFGPPGAFQRRTDCHIPTPAWWVEVINSLCILWAWDGNLNPLISCHISHIYYIMYIYPACVQVHVHVHVH